MSKYNISLHTSNDLDLRWVDLNEYSILNRPLYILQGPRNLDKVYANFHFNFLPFHLLLNIQIHIPIHVHIL